MQRLATALIFAVSAATLAHAETPARADASDMTLTVPYSAATLRDPAAFEALKHRVAVAADAFCRAHPAAGTTISDCRRTLAQSLQVQAETRRMALIRSDSLQNYASK